MPFLTQALLELEIVDGSVQAVEDAYPGTIATLIASGDKLATRWSGIQPPADAADSDPEMRLYLSYVVQFHMMRYQAGLSQEDVKNRLDNYNLARREISAMSGQAVSDTYELPEPSLSESEDMERLGGPI